jgi:hypothetical protein
MSEEQGWLMVSKIALLIERAERAELECQRLQHFIDCADTPMMRDLLAERDRLREALQESRDWIDDDAALPWAPMMQRIDAALAPTEEGT